MVIQSTPDTLRLVGLTGFLSMTRVRLSAQLQTVWLEHLRLRAQRRCETSISLARSLRP